MTRTTLLSILLASCPVATFAQIERPSQGLQSKGQYKKIHRHRIQLLADGQVDKYLNQMDAIWAKDPADGESSFGLAIAHSLKGDQKKSAEFVKLAMHNDVNIRRFFAGPRVLTQKLLPVLESLQESKTVRLLHGPMIGNLRSDGVDIWMRTRHESKIAVQVSQQTFESSTSKKNDFTGIVRIEGLPSNTRFDYSVWIDGQKIDLPYATNFKTLPDSNAIQQLTVAFGGGAGYTPFKERMWNTIASHRPDLLFLLGDNVYIDLPESPAAQRYCYYRRQSRPEFRSLVARTPVYTVWDDHDFGTNDCKGGPEIDFPIWKKSVYKIFAENWVNPGYGGGMSAPGCYYTARFGPAEFFFLDTRYYRDPGKSMLGPVQLAWFQNKLKSSNAKFKVICSSVPMARGTKPGSKDTWDGFDIERETIFQTIEKNQISGVFVMSADRHRSDAWNIHRPNGYDTFEFMSSRLTNIHVHRIMPKSLIGYNEKCSFGLAKFNFRADDPTITYQVYNIDNEFIFEVSCALSRLQTQK